MSQRSYAEFGALFPGLGEWAKWGLSHLNEIDDVTDAGLSLLAAAKAYRDGADQVAAAHDALSTFAQVTKGPMQDSPLVKRTFGDAAAPSDEGRGARGEPEGKAAEVDAAEIERCCIAADSVAGTTFAEGTTPPAAGFGAGGERIKRLLEMLLQLKPVLDVILPLLKEA